MDVGPVLPPWHFLFSFAALLFTYRIRVGPSHLGRVQDLGWGKGFLGIPVSCWVGIREINWRLGSDDEAFMFYFSWCDMNASLGEKKNKKKTLHKKWRWNVQVSDELRILNAAFAGTVFDLWKLNQIWSPVPLWRIYLWYHQTSGWKSRVGRQCLQVVAVFVALILHQSSSCHEGGLVVIMKKIC